MSNANTKTKEVSKDVAKSEERTITMSALELIKKHGSKSAAIRALSAEGFERGPIAKALGLRYQHVRNVLVTPIKSKPATGATV